MSLPTGTPTEFKVAVVEKKRDLEPKGDMPAKVILKLGLVAGEEKGWAELFSDLNEATWPKVGSTETFILTQPENPEWALKAKRPPRGGGFGGGKRDPAQTKRIERMHAQEMAIRFLAARGGLGAGENVPALDHANSVLKSVIDWFVEDTGR